MPVVFFGYVKRMMLKESSEEAIDGDLQNSFDHFVLLKVLSKHTL